MQRFNIGNVYRDALIICVSEIRSRSVGGFIPRTRMCSYLLEKHCMQRPPPKLALPICLSLDISAYLVVQLQVSLDTVGTHCSCSPNHVFCASVVVVV
jgi:hypothetical protein